MRKPHAPDTQAAPDRRSFLRGSVMFGTGVLAAGALGSETVLAQQAPAAPAAPAVGAAKPPALTYAQVMNKARELMYPICRVCPECDGVACAGEVPAWGASARAIRSRTTIVPSSAYS
jgi:4-hydroxymandelate oxidase